MNKPVFLILGVILFLSSVSVNAQKTFAFFDMEQIFSIMPEATLAEAQFEGEQTKIMSQFEEMQVEFNKLYEEFTQNQGLKTTDPNKWSAIILEDKQLELTGIQERMQRFQTTAQQSLQETQMKLLEPVYNKIDSAVAVVVDSKGYPFAFDKGDVFYINEKKCDDITPLIKKVLGLLE